MTALDCLAASFAVFAQEEDQNQALITLLFLRRLSAARPRGLSCSVSCFFRHTRRGTPDLERYGLLWSLVCVLREIAAALYSSFG